MTGEMRDSALVLDGFFVIGFILLMSLLVFENKAAETEAMAV